MYDFTIILHSWLRWALLLWGIYALYNNYTGLMNERKYSAKDLKINTIFIAFLHTQLLLGFILYAGVSPMMQNIFADFGGAMKNKDLRFWAVEHMVGMIIGVLVAQVGSILSKKRNSDASRFRTAFLYFAVGLFIILMMIPFGIWNAERPLFRL